jgi:hypothetical protein
MKNIITKAFSSHLTQQFIESISEPANNVYYLVTSKSTEYAGGDSTIPQPNNSIQETQVDVYQQAIFGKKIEATDVMMMIPRYNWASGTKFARYDNTDGDIFNKPFYAVVDGGSNYFVYKVLDNNSGAESTDQPLNTSETACNFITTADGYVWKLMYKMPESTFEKFATSDFIPVVTSANVAGNTVAGAIDVVKVVNAGSNYVSTLTGQFTADDLRDSIPTISGDNTTYRLNANAASNSDFYVGSALYISTGTGQGQIKSITAYNSSTRVLTVNGAFTTPPSTDSVYVIAPNVVVNGDGTGASGYAIVASNSTVNNFVSTVQVVNRGSGYTYASATVVGNTGGVSNTATIVPIIPPKGGHGSDAPVELGSSSLGISITLANTENGFISAENDFRTLLILKDPLFNGVTLTLDDEFGTFDSGELVYQVDSKKLTGLASFSTASVTVVGTDTDFVNSIKAGDSIILQDSLNNTQCIRTVESVSNSTSLTLSAEPSLTTSSGTVYFTTINSRGTKSGNTSPYVTMSNAEPKFIVGKRVIGASSGAWANVTAVAVNEKSFNNWKTFDNRTRIAYSANTSEMSEDSVVYQTSVSVSNAYFHSANSSYVFLTSEKGPINANPSQPLVQLSGSATFTLGSIKYEPDLVQGSGDVIYIENNSPITRSNTQSETVRLIMNF